MGVGVVLADEFVGLPLAGEVGAAAEGDGAPGEDHVVEHAIADGGGGVDLREDASEHVDGFL